MIKFGIDYLHIKKKTLWRIKKGRRIKSISIIPQPVKNCDHDMINLVNKDYLQLK